MSICPLMLVTTQTLDKLVLVTTVGILGLSWYTNDPETLRTIAVVSTIVCNGLLIWKAGIWETRLRELQFAAAVGDSRGFNSEVATSTQSLVVRTYPCR